MAEKQGTTATQAPVDKDLCVWFVKGWRKRSKKPVAHMDASLFLDAI